MIHFDFTVDEEDAFIIFDCITHKINYLQELILNSAMTEPLTEPEINHINIHIKYLKNLCEKMKNSSVE